MVCQITVITLLSVFLILSKKFYHIQCLIIYCTYFSWSQIHAGIMFGSVLIEKTENRKNPYLVLTCIYRLGKVINKKYNLGSPNDYLVKFRGY